MSSEIPIDFYFDFLSPYSYLAFVQLKRIAKKNPDVEINYKPTLFPGLLNHWGQLGIQNVNDAKNKSDHRPCRNQAKERLDDIRCLEILQTP
jgi:2-hydroxychromene-2-carboxylate isomerase